MSAAMSAAVSEARRAFYRAIDPLGLAPLWEVLHALVPARPASAAEPALWRWQDVRPEVLRAGELIGAAEAVRRVLIMENPGLRGQSSATGTLYAGLQLILPGEVAPSHRHSQTALRFVLEGRGAYTAVNGERHTMEPGDFVITPSWTWHDHGNPGHEPVIWLDGLDIPLLRMLDAGFAENRPDAGGPATGPTTGPASEPERPEGDALARYGSNLRPYPEERAALAAPLFVYPYGRSRAAVLQLARSGPPHPVHGYKMQYINPTTGGAAMRTMATFLQLLPRGFTGHWYRSTDASVHSVVEGHGWIEIGESPRLRRFEWGPRDHFVVPSWQPYRIGSAAESVLFSFSDRPVHEALGIWREALT
jgi:gentisate 1,2-dioxygenase